MCKVHPPSGLPQLVQLQCQSTVAVPHRFHWARLPDNARVEWTTPPEPTATERMAAPPNWPTQCGPDCLCGVSRP